MNTKPKPIEVHDMTDDQVLHLHNAIINSKAACEECSFPPEVMKTLIELENEIAKRNLK